MKYFLLLLFFIPIICFAANWECVDNPHPKSSWDTNCELERYFIYTGWIIRRCGNSCSITYIPDPKHEWKL